LLLDLVRAHDSSRALEHLHDRSEHVQVSAGPGLVHAPIHSEATDKAGDYGTLGCMTSGDDTGERNDIPELAAAVEELRTLLRAFDDVRPADMDERFYIHAYNERDLAGCTIVNAFDQERDEREEWRK